jgi:hypothetical protein
VAILVRLLACYVLILFLLLSFPASGTPDPGQPWEELLQPLEICRGEEIRLQGYLFLPASEAGGELPAGAAVGGGDAALPPCCQWVRVAGEKGDYLVFRVEGEDIPSCRRRIAYLHGILKREPAARAWSAEALIPGSEEDLASLAKKMARLWGAEIRGWDAAGGDLNITAFVPAFPAAIQLEGAEVNLNLELHYDRYAEGIRVRAGIPLLISYPGPKAKTE